MKQAIDAFPLTWPYGHARTPPHRRVRAPFRLGQGALARIRDAVIHEVELLGGKNIILSTDIPIRKDGLPYARMRNPDDPGAAIYWHDPVTKTDQVVAIDRWDLIAHNLRAIEKTINALRGIERWGGAEIMNRAFRGFSQLAPADHEDWRAVFNFPYGTKPPFGEVREKFLELARQAHPDRGGDAKEMTRLTTALEAARRELGGLQLGS